MMKDITFIVQGPVDIEDLSHNKTLKSIREYFPCAKVIISTWGRESGIFLHDKNLTIVTNVDPGSDSVSGDKWAVNFIRQGVSTLGGLLYCETKYACKIRSDCYFANDSLVAIFSDFVKSKKPFLFTDKITRFPYYNYAVDWFQIGPTKDLINIWNESLKIDQRLNYFDDFIYSFYDKEVNFYARYHPEQLIHIALHPEVKIVDRAFRPHVVDYLKQRYRFGESYYTIGKINIGLMCSKHPNRLNDYRTNFKTFKILSFVFPVFDLIIGVISWFHYMFKGRLQGKKSKIF